MPDEDVENETHGVAGNRALVFDCVEGFTECLSTFLFANVVIVVEVDIDGVLYRVGFFAGGNWNWSHGEYRCGLGVGRVDGSTSDSFLLHPRLSLRGKNTDAESENLAGIYITNYRVCRAMLSALPDRPLSEEQVESLEEGQAVHDTMVLAGMGWGQHLVIQFILRTQSATHVLVYAAPDDEEHDGWFVLETYRVSGEGRYPDASEVAAEYMVQFGKSAYLEDYYGQPVDGSAVVESEYTV